MREELARKYTDLREFESEKFKNNERAERS